MIEIGSNTNILMLQIARVVSKRSQFVISWVGQNEIATTVAGSMRDAIKRYGNLNIHYGIFIVINYA